MKKIALLLASLAPSLALAEIPADHVTTRGGLVRAASGVRARPLPGSPADAARAFVLSHAADLGLTGPTLSPGRVASTSLGRVVRFDLTYRGLPVPGARVTVALDRDNRVLRVASSAEPIREAVAQRNVSPSAALDRAAAGMDGVFWHQGHPAGAWREVFFVRGGVARLGYEVHVAAIDPLSNVYALVDAATGELVWRRNRVYFDDKAQVWRSNPGTDGKRPLEVVDLEGLAEPRDPDGKLVGTLIDAYNCCATAGCQPGAPAKQIAGKINYFGREYDVLVDFCDLQQRASNVAGGRTDYQYGSPDPLSYDPPKTEVGKGAAGESDEFAEVHVFYHANLAYKFFRELSAKDDPAAPPFVLRDGLRDPPVKPQVWANFLLPNYYNQTEQNGVVVIKGLLRVDNAAFLPRESWAELLMGATDPTLPKGDVLALFQGEHADFGYDGDVIYHEFAHGVVYSTAALEGTHVDQYGALDEAGSLHEGFADFFAGALTLDPRVADWIGPKVAQAMGEPGDGALRDMENDARCPDVIIGEVHHDSVHFSGGTWELRKKFAGADEGRTFDAAVFHALNAMNPTDGFDEAALAIADAVAAAFPQTTTARDDVLAVYRARGVLECVRVADYAGPRKEYSVLGTSSGYAPFAPGPVQLRIKAPLGAQSITVAASAQQSGFAPPSITALASVGRHVKFSGEPSDLTHDAQFVKELTANMSGRLTGSIPAKAKPGEDIVVTLINEGGDALALTDVTLTLRIPPQPDAGMPPDASEAAAVDAGSPPPADEPEGCGCGAASAPPVLAVGALALSLLRRRRAR